MLYALSFILVIAGVVIFCARPAPIYSQPFGVRYRNLFDRNWASTLNPLKSARASACTVCVYVFFFRFSFSSFYHLVFFHFQLLGHIIRLSFIWYCWSLAQHGNSYVFSFALSLLSFQQLLFLKISAVINRQIAIKTRRTWTIARSVAWFTWVYQWHTLRSTLPRTVTTTTTATSSSQELEYQLQSLTCPPPPPPPSFANLPAQPPIPLPVYYHSAETTYGTYRFVDLISIKACLARKNGIGRINSNNLMHLNKLWGFLLRIGDAALSMSWRRTSSTKWSRRRRRSASTMPL